MSTEKKREISYFWAIGSESDSFFYENRTGIASDSVEILKNIIKIL